VVVKLTPNVTDIACVAQSCKNSGADALCAINTVSGLVGVDLDTLTPMPSVGGVSTYGGYSGPAVKPIALRCISQIAKATGLPVSGLGGVASWEDAAELMAVGAGTVQVGTAVMWQGFGIIDSLNGGLRDYLVRKKFAGTEMLIGAALDKIVEFSRLPTDHRMHAIVDDTCNGCRECITSCNDSGFQAISVAQGGSAQVDPDKCDGCGLCVMVCSEESISMVNRQ
jgi:dihydropyrimidine dehydrogenase (NAD+) subunit PreA